MTAASSATFSTRSTDKLSFDWKTRMSNARRRPSAATCSSRAARNCCSHALHQGPQPLRSAFFLDIGNVFNTKCSADPAQLLRYRFRMNCATRQGIGVTWISGFGPMTFSLAKPLNASATVKRCSSSPSAAASDSK
jgi:hypothetical protein